MSNAYLRGVAFNNAVNYNGNFINMSDEEKFILCSVMKICNFILPKSAMKFIFKENVFYIPDDM